MSKISRFIKLILIFILMAGIMACAPSKKNPYLVKKKKNSHVNASQLGRNKYYFSSGYQKKLGKNSKKK